MSRLGAATDRCCCGRVCVCVFVWRWRWRWLNGWKETVRQCEIWKQFDCIKAFKASPLISPLASRQRHTHPPLCGAAQKAFHNYAFTCLPGFFIYTFVYSFIHLLLTSFWSSCHLLYNRWTETFVCPCKLCLRGARFKVPGMQRGPVSVNRSPRAPWSVSTLLFTHFVDCQMTLNSMIDNRLVSPEMQTCSRVVKLYLLKVKTAYFLCDSVHSLPICNV